jgi:hypothetical protein
MPLGEEEDELREWEDDASEASSRESRGGRAPGVWGETLVEAWRGGMVD